MTTEEAKERLIEAAKTGNIADVREALTAVADVLEAAASKQHGHAAHVTKDRKDKGPPQVGG